MGKTLRFLQNSDLEGIRAFPVWWVFFFFFLIPWGRALSPCWERNAGRSLLNRVVSSDYNISYSHFSIYFLLFWLSTASRQRLPIKFIVGVKCQYLEDPLPRVLVIKMPQIIWERHGNLMANWFQVHLEICPQLDSILLADMGWLLSGGSAQRRQRNLELNIKCNMLFMTGTPVSAKTCSYFSWHILLHLMCRVGRHRSTLCMKKSHIKHNGHRKLES